MVFETIYSLYEKEVVNEIKKLKTDEEIKFIERKGIIRDIVLKRLAKALSVAVYRNGKIEDVHCLLYTSALFLDIDGVLNTRTTVVGAPSGRTGIDESRVRLLKKALKQFGDAAIVLTSDWKLMREDGDDFSYLVSMLGKFGLSLSGKTTDVWVDVYKRQAPRWRNG